MTGDRFITGILAATEPAELDRQLNNLKVPAGYRLAFLQPGKFGRYDGLNEERDLAYMFVFEQQEGASKAELETPYAEFREEQPKPPYPGITDPANERHEEDDADSPAWEPRTNIMDYVKRAAQVSEVLLIPESIVEEHAAWSMKTFGLDNVVGPVAPLKHMAKEAIEAANAWQAPRSPEWVDDLAEEFADIAFLFLDAKRRAGITNDMLLAAMRKKLPVLKARTYDKIVNDEPSHHVKASALREAYGSPAVTPEMTPEDEAKMQALIRSEAVEALLRDFVTEIRAYQSPESDECDIIGPLLKRADLLLGEEHTGPVTPIVYLRPLSEDQAAITTEIVQASSVKQYWNDLKSMTGDKMRRELSDVTNTIDEAEPWQEALTAALNLKVFEPAARKAFAEAHGLKL